MRLCITMRLVHKRCRHPGAASPALESRHHKGEFVTITSSMIFCSRGLSFCSELWSGVVSEKPSGELAHLWAPGHACPLHQGGASEDHAAFLRHVVWARQTIREGSTTLSGIATGNIFLSRVTCADRIRALLLRVPSPILWRMLVKWQVSSNALRNQLLSGLELLVCCWQAQWAACNTDDI